MKNTDLLLMASAAVYGLAGLAGTFFPDALAMSTAGAASRALVLVIQCAAAAYCGFAMLNWMLRDATLGGIYGRPLVVANLLHFFMVAMIMTRLVLQGARGPLHLAVTALAWIFAGWFGRVLLGQRIPSAT